jgi:hypothetical protein
MNPTGNLGIWLAILVVSTGVAGWNISRLLTVRPAFDRLVAILGACAILAVVAGSSLVFTEVTECGFAASSFACSYSELALVGLTGLALGGALITLWLRSDACRAPRVRTRRERTIALTQ